LKSAFFQIDQDMVFKKIEMMKEKKSCKVIALILVLLLTLFLSYYNFGNENFGNMYYTAAIKSMMSSFHNFFYVSFDPAGFVSVDKPPVALWIQVAFAKVFGIHSWSLILPEALAAVGSVAVLFHIIKRTFGYLAGILAAFSLAITPIFIAVARTNNPDAILVLLLILAAWQLNLATEKGSLKHLILAAIMLGLGFNTKMLVAYLVVPSFIIVYFFASGLKLSRRIIHLSITGVVLLIVSFSWVMTVDLTPASQRPYVGSSTTNSEINLVFGYNGLSRVAQSNFMAENGLSGVQSENTAQEVTSESNIEAQSAKSSPVTPAGILRMFHVYFGEQIGWFIPLVAFGILSVIYYSKSLNKEEKRKIYSQLFLWGSWVVVMLVFFSAYSNMTHRYYTDLLAPALAALVGSGLSCMRKIRKQKVIALSFPIALIISAIFQITVVMKYHYLSKALIPVLIGCLILALLLIIQVFFESNDISAEKYVRMLSVCCLAVIFFAPAYWSFTTVLGKVNQGDPHAGPMLLSRSLPSIGTVVQKLEFNASDHIIPKYYQEVASYLEKNQGNAKYLAAFPNASLLAEYVILQTGKPVMTIGGYSGTNPILTLNQFKATVSTGNVKCFIDESNQPQSQNDMIFEWAVSKGQKVDMYIKNVPIAEKKYSAYSLSDANG
jgi:4-amino-4-deoxy-L-arabinose transferase-like glycosyltransferase